MTSASFLVWRLILTIPWGVARAHSSLVSCNSLLSQIITLSWCDVKVHTLNSAFTGGLPPYERGNNLGRCEPHALAEEDKCEDAKWPKRMSLTLSSVQAALIQFKARLGKQRVPWNKNNPKPWVEPAQDVWTSPSKPFVRSSTKELEQCQ